MTALQQRTRLVNRLVNQLRLPRPQQIRQRNNPRPLTKQVRSPEPLKSLHPKRNLQRSWNQMTRLVLQPKNDQCTVRPFPVWFTIDEQLNFLSVGRPDGLPAG